VSSASPPVSMAFVDLRSYAAAKVYFNVQASTI
jgi:hypothetical protein